MKQATNQRPRGEARGHTGKAVAASLPPRICLLSSPLYLEGTRAAEEPEEAALPAGVYGRGGVSAKRCQPAQRTSDTSPSLQLSHSRADRQDAYVSLHGQGGGTGIPLHIRVGDLCQEIHQGVSSERAHVLILLKLRWRH